MVWVETTIRRPGSSSVCGAGGQDGRHQIGEALAHARARLDHQVMALLDGGRNRFGHGELLTADFVVVQSGSDAAFGPQDIGGRTHGFSITGVRGQGPGDRGQMLGR